MNDRRTRGGESLTLRAVRPADADVLTTIALRAKAHWGYDERFMTLAHAELSWQPSALRRPEIRGELASHADAGVGFYILDWQHPDEPELDAMFVEPGWIGRGVGRVLMDRAVATARAAGAREMVIQSDPNAAGFYCAMGAQPAGTRPSDSIPGRDLPLLRLVL